MEDVRYCISLHVDYLSSFSPANQPVYQIAFAVGASGPGRSTIFDLQKDILENVVNLPATSDRSYALIQYGKTADIRSRFEQFRNTSAFLQTVRSLSSPDPDISDLLTLLQKAPDLFRSSPSNVNKRLVIFTNSLLPSDLRPLAKAADALNRQDVKVVVVTTGDRTDRARVSNWIPVRSYVVEVDPRNVDGGKSAYQIGSIVYTGMLSIFFCNVTQGFI